MFECLNLLITHYLLLITHYSLPIAFREGNEAQKSTAGFSRKSRERYHERQETETTIVAGWKSLSSAIGKLPATTASQTPEAVEAALPAPTSPPEASAAESIPVQSKESSLTHRLQAPDKEATVRFTVDMYVGRAPPTVGAGGADWAQQSRSGCCYLTDSKSFCGTRTPRLRRSLSATYPIQKV